MINASVLTEAAVLAEVNKGIGVLIAVVGAIITAPAGWRELLTSSTNWARTQANRILNLPPQTINLSGSGSSESFGNAVLTNRPPPLNADQPLADQVAMVHAYVRSVESRLNQVTTRLAEDKSARDKQLADLTTSLETGLGQLDERISEQERQAGRIDARGLPVIAAGVVLSGIPEWLAALPLHLGWILPFAGFGLMVRALGFFRSPSA
ncbi:hypothetical protein [Nonomuraea roseola]|uniref:DUF4349 domain-containing protein n=1 Tax=Nonomuraea roseola TaxID=46179 RepID=A0ABV5Q4N9_9ACTN